MNTSTAIVLTPNGSRYLQQLCKHWGHNLAVEFTSETGSVIFPRDGRGGSWPQDGRFTMQADAAALSCRIEASAPGQLEGLKGAVERHLNRFAFREGELAFDWADD